LLQVLATIQKLNEDPSVHGILVQLPLPKGMDERLVTESIHPRKDVDGCGPVGVAASEVQDAPS